MVSAPSYVKSCSDFRAQAWPRFKNKPEGILRKLLHFISWETNPRRMFLVFKVERPMSSALAKRSAFLVTETHVFDVNGGNLTTLQVQLKSILQVLTFARTV